MTESQYVLCGHLKASAALFLLATLSTVGCGAHTADVQGRVTIDGEPLTNTIICYQPTGGPLVQSPLDENGRYRLVTPGIGRGVNPGSYLVYLATVPSEEDELAKTRINESDLIAGRSPPPVITQRISPKAMKYYSATTSDWTRQVEAGSNEFDFDIVTN